MWLSFVGNACLRKHIVLNKSIWRTLAGHAKPPTSSPVAPVQQSKVEQTLDQMRETPLKVDTSELDKPQWERSSRTRVFYGFDYKDAAQDKFMVHFFVFTFITCLMIIPGFFLWYRPDGKLRNWAIREAHLELSRRRQAGEPLINPDYIPSEQVKLPSDEEIGDLEIKI